MVRCRSWLLRPRHAGSSGGSHEAISDGGSVPELGVEASKTKKLGVVPESNRLSKCVVRLSLPMDYRPQAF
jgi:hypothetical protein